MQLMQHQSKGVDIARQRPKYCFYHEPGCGKTIMILAAVSDAKARGYAGKTLVLAPKSILQSAWAGDAVHFPDLKLVVVWHQKPAERKKLINTPNADILVTNYETFKKHAADFIAAGVTRLVIDESQKIKATETQISKAAFDFSRKCDSVYLLSGTPAPNCETEYYSQVRCIDPGLFGGSFWRFAFSYFAPQKRWVDGKERIVGWKLLDSRREAFQEKLRQVSWSLRKEDCLDLPEQVDVIREVQLSEDESAAYDQMLEDLRVTLGDGTTIDANATARIMKLRQITGGMVLAGGEPQYIGSSKLDELYEILEEIGDRQVVIWAQFTAEIDRIMESLADSGRSVSRIDGSVGMDDRAAAISAFQAGKTQCMVCHPAAAGHGITLTAASYAIYYSLNFSFETYKQSRDRIHRKGQRNVCTFYHLIAKNTIDEKIFWALKGKKSAHEAIMLLLGNREEVTV